MLRSIHLGAVLIWQGGGILRLDNEDRTLLQQTANLLEDVRPREICAGVCGASGEGRLLYASTHTFGRDSDMGELLSWLVNVFRDVWPGEASEAEARQRRSHPATANHRPVRGHAPARDLCTHHRSSCGYFPLMGHTRRTIA